MEYDWNCQKCPPFLLTWVTTKKSKSTNLAALLSVSSLIIISASIHSILFLFYWSTVDLQCCVNFCCTAKWFSYIHIYIYSFSYSFPLWFITGYWIWFPVLYSRTLSLSHPLCNSLHLLIPNSQSIPPRRQQVCSLCLCICFCFVDKFICVIY